MGTKIAIIGATGRMGQLATEIIESDSNLELFASLDSKSDLNLTLGADFIFELTNPSASEKIVEFAIANNKNILVGSSGWTTQKIENLGKSLSGSTSVVLIVPNFSLGSVLATKFAAEAAKHFDSVEILETHHTGKLDSPSGTALFTAATIAAELPEIKKVVGAGEPARGQLVEGIPVHSLRISGAHAEQEVILASENERLIISHSVSSHTVYSNGMLMAMKRIGLLKGLNVGLATVLDLESN